MTIAKWEVFCSAPMYLAFYLIPPEQSRIQDNFISSSPRSQNCFQAYVASDDSSEQVLYDQVLGDKKSKLALSREINIPLSKYVGKAIRLTLKTQELDKLSSKSSTYKSNRQVAWLSPRIDSVYPAPQDIPPIKRLIIWALDGIKLDSLMYESRLREAFPSLKLLIDHGVSFSRLWSKELIIGMVINSSFLQRQIKKA